MLLGHESESNKQIPNVIKNIFANRVCNPIVPASCQRASSFEFRQKHPKEAGRWADMRERKPFSSKTQRIP